jgi:tetratricopeptide (TPR) repeat protein
VRYFAYELIAGDANAEFAQGHYDRACRRYEEALGVFRYYEATSADWQEKGIDDDHLRHVDTIGNTPEEKTMIREIKLSCFQNIAACSIKTKSFDEAILACTEVLKLDPTNMQALYRRARATALPINAGVPDL